jgi:hypothetical protein
MNQESRDVGARPNPRARERAKTSACAALRQATWEATQFLTYDEVREYVDGVLREVESDEP